MKVLLIGGTGVISSDISKLVIQNGGELYLLNRGSNNIRTPEGAVSVTADINDEETVERKLSGMTFDVVADFIAFHTENVKRDLRLFTGKTSQYIFISSASAYQKPLNYYKINESTPLYNPYWEYSRNKIECENLLLEEYRTSGFPVTIVRPSHTYNETKVPVALHGKNGCYQVLDRILKGKPVVIHGDGSSLWTITHSADFARGFWGLMGNYAALGEAVQITSDESLPWDTLYDFIGRALNRKVEKVHISADFLSLCDPSLRGGLLGDKANTVVFDNSKLKRLVPGFCAEIRAEEGIRKSVEYILSHPVLQKPDSDFDRFCDRIIRVREHALDTFRADTENHD